MKGPRTHLGEMVQIIQRDGQFGLYRYELHAPPSHIIFIDIIPTSEQPFSQQQQFAEYCYSTIMLIAPSTQNHPPTHVQCVRRRSRIIRQLASPRRQPTSPVNQPSCKTLQFAQGLENVCDSFKKRKQVEIIKTGWPHGITIQISYIEQCRRWIISDGRESRLADEQEYIDSKGSKGERKLDQIVDSWMKIIGSMGSTESMKKKLSNVTITGKLIKKNKQVLFFSVVENESGVDIEPFEARERIEKMGLKFVPIRSLGMFDNQESMSNSLSRAIKSIRSEVCESRAFTSGRSKIYFVKHDASFIEGANVSTAEDMLLREIKNILTSKIDFNERLTLFSERLAELNGLLPLPEVSYQRLFENLIRLIEILSLSGEQIQHVWWKLPKLCLYLLSKRLPFEKYAKLYFSPEPLDQISEIALEEFGPIESKISVIYYFIHPSMELKLQIANHLKTSYEAIDLPFSIIQEQITGIATLKKIIMQSSANLSHYFILPIVHINELRNLQSSLNTASKDHFYKVIYLTESFKGETSLNENTYPFSWTSIVNSYLEALDRTRTAAKLQEKIKELSKVTSNINDFKNCEVMNLKNRISINLHDFNQSRQLKNSIEKVLLKYERDLFLILILKLQKQGGSPFLEEKQLALQVTNILKKSYASIRTISIKSQ